MTTGKLTDAEVESVYDSYAAGITAIANDPRVRDASANMSKIERWMVDRVLIAQELLLAEAAKLPKK